ncbi:DNA-directed RNA polymerase I core subunit rpa12 [Gnomoniopsis smithogilvyi]|uniref:DNA-directed RNA polymerase subunit n=1 Tax=Gnomoniopsis smithogilvyi TaxID=1191159 RepID=A0A9W9CWN2_9PEZI|nr:DNA-directed RNA polymerase I core subunit rpa12 [Gnomoniopsis smithogilvyi]
MASIGSLVFCTDCGNLLPSSKGSQKNILQCECCGAENQDEASKEIVTKSKPSDFPSFLRQKLSTTQTVKRHEVNTEAKTDQTCPKCGRTEVRFSAVQLRSADEGSTIFYTCDCGFKWSENN